MEKKRTKINISLVIVSVAFVVGMVLEMYAVFFAENPDTKIIFMILVTLWLLLALITLLLYVQKLFFKLDCKDSEIEELKYDMFNRK